MSTESSASLERCLFRAGAAHPFLREPIEGMGRVEDGSIGGLATDGANLYFRPGAEPGDAAVGHLLMHCLFRHMLSPERAVRPLWDLACDMAAEYLRTEFFPGGEGQLTRLVIADALPEGVDPRVAPAVYRALMDLFPDELEPLRGRFARDDHRYWYAPPPRNLFPPGTAPGGSPGEGKGDGPAAYRAWQEEVLDALWPSADELPGGASRTGRYGLAPGSRQERMLLREQGRYDFTRYLRRFSTTQEELRLDLSGFDYIPYCYGLERYGNMPLIEPLETVESHKVESLVIAIDTSGSCTRPVVERFFAEIERILMRHDQFFRRMDLHLMQCDAVLQSDVAIHCREDWERYRRDLVVRGRGGTDFRPVFRRVEELRARGELKDLKGLLYFTDGDGAYPQKKPPYETAFVFSTRRALEVKKPEWIVPLVLN